jgi:iron complex transport system substrate-binding protein
MGELGEALGMENAWTGEVDEAYGLGQTDIEGMTAVGDATFFYTGTVDPEGDVMAELEKNQIWTSLPAVAEGRAHAFPPGVWTFGGPRSSMQVVDAYVDLLTS